MKSLLSFITEYKGHAIRDKEKSIGDPDEIKHYFDSGWVHLKFNKDNAYPYVYNKKMNKIIFGKPNTIHNNIFNPENEKELKEMGLENVTKIGQIRYCCGGDDNTEEIDKWYEENKQYVDNTICGRLWYDAQDDFESWDSEEQAEQMAAIFGKLKEFDSSKCYIVNWNEIDSNDFQQITDNIVKLFAEQHNIKIKSYIAIDNNGEPIEMFVGEHTKVEKRSNEREKEISKLMNIHNPQDGESLEEFRKRKRKAIHGYIKSRDEHFQRDYYNKTKSKTAAEWHNNKTKKYNPHTGKMEWGEKIGDSLQMKTIKDYINESQNFLVKGHTKKQHIDYIDLDLPSGTKWATCNIGADKPEDYGLLFQWGRVDGYEYKDKNHKFLSRDDDFVTTSGTEYKKCDTLKPEDDAAYQATKGKFRMPTREEIDELIKHTKNEWTELNGVKGYKFISKKSKKDNSKWIFIPAAGCFFATDGLFYYAGSKGFVWSASVYYSTIYCVYDIEFKSGDCARDYNNIGCGFSVRGVLNK